MRWIHVVLMMLLFAVSLSAEDKRDTANEAKKPVEEKEESKKEKAAKKWTPGPASSELAALRKKFGERIVAEAEKQVDAKEIAKKYKLRYPPTPPKHTPEEVKKLIEKELAGDTDKKKIRFVTRKIWRDEGYVYRSATKSWIPRIEIMEMLYFRSVGKIAAEIYWQEQEKRRGKD